MTSEAMEVKFYIGLRAFTDNILELSATIRQTLDPIFYNEFEKTRSLNTLPRDHYDEVQKAFGSLMYGFEHPAINFGYEVTLLPQRLLMVFSEFGEYTTALIKAGIVENCSIVGDGTKPTDMKSQKWGARKNTHSEFFGKAPGMIGVSFTHPPKLETIVEIDKRICASHHWAGDKDTANHVIPNSGRA